MSKLKKFAPHIACFAAGTAAGLALATTAIGVKAVQSIAALRSKAGI